MNIGERIKSRRKELGLSIDDVAERLNKNRATVYRYESNYIENLPLTVLEPLAKVLSTSPTFLLGMEETNNNEFTKEELKILSHYNKLNDLGKQEAEKRISELTCINKYTKKSKDIETLEDAKEYLKNFQIAAYGGSDIDKLSDEEFIEYAKELKHQFEDIPHKYKK